MLQSNNECAYMLSCRLSLVPYQDAAPTGFSAYSALAPLMVLADQEQRHLGNTGGETELIFTQRMLDWTGHLSVKQARRCRK